MIDPSPGRPVYRQVADVLRTRIAGLQPEAMLPGERDLAWELEVGVGAVRDALRVLEEEGLIERRPGARARVRPVLERVVVQLPANARIRVRRATEEDLAELRLAAGELVVEVESDDGLARYGSDRVELRTHPS